MILPGRICIAYGRLRGYLSAHLFAAPSAVCYQTFRSISLKLMIRRSLIGVVLAAGLVLAGVPAAAQTTALQDPVLQRIWTEGMEKSQLYRLGQVLMDSIGPRLVGSPAMEASQEWIASTYESWGISARHEPYGTWIGWERGITHVDLIEPRVRSLEGMMLAWSPGTNGPVEGPVIAMPEFTDAEAFQAWLPQVRGAFVLISFPEPTCRPDAAWEEYATPETVRRLRAERADAYETWVRNLRRTGLTTQELSKRLDEAGAAGVLSSSWTGGWGATRLFGTTNKRAPAVGLSCEDYGLVYRLAENNQNPVLRVETEARFLGEVPVSNTIGEIKGTEKPDEYVVLSAHLDTWDGASGATDNGTGTIIMMEAMRILKEVYPNPKRTIIVAHWNGEEQGLNGSRAFSEDHPEIVENMQVLLNQDNGTGRVGSLSMSGFTEAGRFFSRWLDQIPTEITQHIEMEDPGAPASGGSDHASFQCHGAPAIRLGSDYWDYRDYTWHTTRDTFDKISFDDVRSNAVLTAMLAYLASEEPERIPRARISDAQASAGGGQQAAAWPDCRPATRSAEGR